MITSLEQINFDISSTPEACRSNVYRSIKNTILVNLDGIELIGCDHDTLTDEVSIRLSITKDDQSYRVDVPYIRTDTFGDMFVKGLPKIINSIQSL